MLLLGILFIAACLRAPFTAVPPLLEPIQQAFALPTLASGALTTLPLLAFALLSPLSARFAQQHGLERSLLFALLAIALGIVLRSLAGVAGLFAGTAVIGMGIAVANVLLPSLLKRDFPRQLASLTSAYVLAMGVAAALGSAVVIPLAELAGWRWALLSFLVLPLLALLLWLPQLRGAATVAAAPALVAGGALWRSPLAWQVTLFLGLNSTIYYVVVSWLPAMLGAAGQSAAQAGSLHGVMQLATAVPGLLLGPLLARLPDQRLVAGSVCLMSALALLGLLLAPALALLWSLLFGLGTGAGIILGLSLIGLRTRSPSQAAALSGMSQGVGYLLAASGPMAMGGLHDLAGGWTLPLACCLVLALIAGVMGMLAGRERSL